MRRPTLLALTSVIVILLGAGVVVFQKYRKTSADYADLKLTEEQQRAHYTDAFNSIASIQDSLTAIALGDSSVGLLSQGLQSEQRLTKSQESEILDRFAVLKAGLQRTKDKIGELESNLKKSGIKIAGLQRMIANLKQTAAEKEGQISFLTVQVDSLQNRVTGLVAEVQQSQDTIRVKEETIEEKRKELGTIYYVIGSKKELTDYGLITARGGILGLGKTLQPTGHVSGQVFTPLDTDAESVIRLPSPKVQILSAQPPSSYQLQLVGGQMELHILDPKEFRTVKHLVIMTT